MKALLFPVFVVLLIVDTKQEKNLIQFLNEKVKNMSRLNIMEENKQTLSEMDNAAIQNSKALVHQISQKKNLINVGGSGSIFKIKGKFESTDNKEKTLAAKEIFVNEDSRTAEGREQQNLLANEILINEYLQEVDPYHIYFVKYQSTYDQTMFFYSQIQSSFDNETKGFLYRKVKNTRYQIYVMFMEMMDFSLAQYFEKVFKGHVDPLFHTRTGIIEYVAQGLLQIVNLITHCDIKPENIVFKHVSKQKSDYLVSQGVPEIELFPNEFFVMNIIDFGVSVRGQRNKRLCTKYTLGYAPLDFYADGGIPKVDVFALAVTMMSLEFVQFFAKQSDQILNFTFNVPNYVLFGVQEYGHFNSELKKIFKESIYYNFITKFWGNQAQQKILLERIKEYYPDFEAILIQKYSINKKKIPKLEVDQIVFSTLKVYQMSFLATVHLAWNHYFQKFVEQDKQNYASKILEIESKMGQIQNKKSEKFLMREEEKRYYQALEQLVSPEMEKRVELINFLLVVVKGDGQYKTLTKLEDFYKQIKSIRKSFESENTQALEYVTLYRRHYLTREHKKGKIQTKSIQSSIVGFEAKGFEERLLI